MTKLDDKIRHSTALLRAFARPEAPYVVGFSGGKDSTALLDLVKRAGVPYTAVYNVTTVDPPELVRFIRSAYPEVVWSYPKLSMFQLIIKNHFPPTPYNRYCCTELKHRSPRGYISVVGVRRDESSKRKDRNAFSKFKNRHILSPLIFWTEADVWQYIDMYKLSYCSLYDEPGCDRLGCVCCPLNRGPRMRWQAERWPKFKKMYLKAFEIMLANRPLDWVEWYNTKWTNADEVWEWWTSDQPRERI